MELNNTNTSPLANQPTKFNDAEIAELTDIRQAYDRTTLALGQLELQKREVKKNETKIEEQLIAVEAQEKVFLDKIVAKYGEGSFDISTGLFTPKNL